MLFVLLVVVVEDIDEGLAITIDVVGLFDLLPMTPSPKSNAKVMAAMPKMAAKASQQGWQHEDLLGGSSSGPNFL